MGARVVALVVVALVRVDVAIRMYRSYRGKGDQTRSEGVGGWMKTTTTKKGARGFCVLQLSRRACNQPSVRAYTVPLTLP